MKKTKKLQKKTLFYSIQQKWSLELATKARVVTWFTSKIVVATTINGPYYIFNSHKLISIIIFIGNFKIKSRI
jgi:hypothetical protein